MNKAENEQQKFYGHKVDNCWIFYPVQLDGTIEVDPSAFIGGKLDGRIVKIEKDRIVLDVDKKLALDAVIENERQVNESKNSIIEKAKSGNFEDKDLKEIIKTLAERL
jgi:hypothetical protein